jgi:all-trans-8'-apo-beta-carotenal 15,15'-oxygenase
MAGPWSAGFRSLPGDHAYRVDVIDGAVPAALRGTLFRNGMGRNDLAGQWFPHWFDGDGMVQAIRFDTEGIHYRNRYVDTPQYRDETRVGHIVHRGFGKMRPGGVLANAFRMAANVSNTSVVVSDGRLFSLWEGGPPYELDPATLATRGPEDFGGAARAFSAHPRIDPDSGELFNFGIDYGRHCTLTPYRLHRGRLTKLPAVTLPHPVMNHDFVLTEHYLVFCLGPILVRPLKFLLGFSSFDGALHWEPGLPTLILLVPRDGGAPRFIETEAFFQFHFANAYEADGAIVLDVARYPDFLTIGPVLRDYWRSDWPAEGMARLTRLRIDLASGRIESRAFSPGVSHEFPRFDPRRVGKPYRYAYIACNPDDRTRGLQQQVGKIDLENGTLATHDFAPNGYVGEPCFIPTSAGEDEGVVVTIVFDAASQLSAIVGLDARDIAARPLFTARLRHHVPYGLHGCFSPD